MACDKGWVELEWAKGNGGGKARCGPGCRVIIADVNAGADEKEEDDGVGWASDGGDVVLTDEAAEEDVFVVVVVVVAVEGLDNCCC